MKGLLGEIKQSVNDFQQTDLYKGTMKFKDNVDTLKDYASIGKSYGVEGAFAQALFDKAYEKDDNIFKKANLKMDLLNNNYFAWTPPDNEHMQNMKFTVGPQNIEDGKVSGLKIGGSFNF